MGYRWVVFTGVRRLYNAFRRLGLRPMELADADPSRLQEDEARRWGNYYRDQPKVYVGRIEDGYRRLISARSGRPAANASGSLAVPSRARCCAHSRARPSPTRTTPP